MSTDHQQYSTQNQADKIREYAEQHGVEIVRTYADEGRSGLNIDDRDALRCLIGDATGFGSGVESYPLAIGKSRLPIVQYPIILVTLSLAAIRTGHGIAPIVGNYVMAIYLSGENSEFIMH